MNLRWNPLEARFEAEFSDFHADLQAVKAAGFKTTGAPQWIWFALNTIPLQKLRDNRPASGLTISPEARAEFNRLAEIDKKNAEVKAQLDIIKKEQKKAKAKEKREGELIKLEVPEKGYIDAEDLPAAPPVARIFVRPAPPETKCFICKDPVYSYEYAEGGTPICLWDSKIVLDKTDDVC